MATSRSKKAVGPHAHISSIGSTVATPNQLRTLIGRKIVSASTKDGDLEIGLSGGATISIFEGNERGLDGGIYSYSGAVLYKKDGQRIILQKT